LITFLKKLKRLKQEWQIRPAGTRQTDGKNLVWFGEMERKLAKFIDLPLNYFMAVIDPNLKNSLGIQRRVMLHFEASQDSPFISNIHNKNTVFTICLCQTFIVRILSTTKGLSHLSHHPCHCLAAGLRLNRFLIE
jgi:hypothetical protein